MATGASPSSTAANLANLLPTGTVLIFEALVPSFSNNGKCELANKWLTLGVIFFCCLACILSSFTDSFLGDEGRKLYYGIATRSGLYIFNDDPYDGLDLDKDKKMREELRKYKLSLTDFVHAIMSGFVFLAVAMSSLDVQGCFFPNEGTNRETLFKYLPLGLGVLASTMFTIFPTRRRGIGCGDMARGAGTAEEKLKKQETVKEEGKERGGVLLHENRWETKSKNKPSLCINHASLSHVNDPSKERRNSFP